MPTRPHLRQQRREPPPRPLRRRHPGTSGSVRRGGPARAAGQGRHQRFSRREALATVTVAPVEEVRTDRGRPRVNAGFLASYLTSGNLSRVAWWARAFSARPACPGASEPPLVAVTSASSTSPKRFRVRFHPRSDAETPALAAARVSRCHQLTFLCKRGVGLDRLIGAVSTVSAASPIARAGTA